MRWTPVAGVVFVALTTACTGGALGPDAPPIARVWESKCGACHTPVEPGTRTRTYLDDALARHKVRLSLSDGEWDEMKDFLAKR